MHFSGHSGVLYVQHRVAVGLSTVEEIFSPYGLGAEPLLYNQMTVIMSVSSRMFRSGFICVFLRPNYISL